MTQAEDNSRQEMTGHVIIAGFGLPGRAVATILQERGERFCVIELNPATVERCHAAGLQIIAGDVADPEVLRRAGITTARLFVVAVPNETVAIEATRLARELNPHVRIITRCHYTSAGMSAIRSGAEAVVVSEQVVAEELRSLIWERLEPLDSPPPHTSNTGAP